MGKPDTNFLVSRCGIDSDKRAIQYSDAMIAPPFKVLEVSLFTYPSNHESKLWLRRRRIEERIRFEDDLVILFGGCIEIFREIEHDRCHDVSDR